MTLNSLAGQPAPRSILVNVPRLVRSYYTMEPHPSEPAERVAFGTSGHRGSSIARSFNEAHIVAITEAICAYRKQADISGPLFLGFDTHALSEPAVATALEILAAHEVDVFIDANEGYTPTPAVSHAIVAYNRSRSSGFADGIVVTPSHNPPEDGGFKYNPPHGGPADGDVTNWIQQRANARLQEGMQDVLRIPYAKAIDADTTRGFDFITPYVNALNDVVDLEAIKRAGLKIGVDPMGGSGIGYWAPIADRYGLDITVVNDNVDPTFSFMTVDKDGRIRMDCSSPYAMAGLIALKDRYDIAFGNDTDFDRHGIVCPSVGLMNPNHYLAAAIHFLFQNRPDWPKDAAVGKTLVSSGIIDRVAGALGRPLKEVPVGFKWFVSGLESGALGFGGEESAGASFLRRNGQVWTTDKDGIILDLLAAEMTAKMGQDPGQIYQSLTEAHGAPVYERIDVPATPEQKAVLKKLSPDQVAAEELAGEPIVGRLTAAPGNSAAIGGLKVVTENGWFAARPSGTENVYKIYTESFRGEQHLAQVQDEAKSIVSKVFAAAGV
ncbi:MAG: phosphoglucomutase (alpha-D-glucose-1,6-bisphosphate-dependent) [Myxococcota bacterium]